LLLQEVLGLPLVPPAAAAAVVPMVVSLVQCFLLQEVLGLPYHDRCTFRLPLFLSRC
jgi:hypothetical protein